MTYLITFTCYGCHLHGHASGSVDRAHSMPGSPLIAPDARRVQRERRRMNQPPYHMDRRRRKAVLSGLLERCAERQWILLAAHVRSNHIHAVVDAEVSPERILNDLKSYASRYLNRLGLDGPDQKRWTRHGSTRRLWKPHCISAAIRYVVDGQGEAMAVFEAASFGRGSEAASFGRGSE